MKKIHITFLVLLLTLLCSCKTVQTTSPSTLPSMQDTAAVETTSAASAPTVIPTSSSEVIPTESTPDPVFVYENAIEDFLLPLEEYSQERQFMPEFVMIHFTSAVVNHRNDPYNIDLVRDIFMDYNVSVHYIIERDGTVRCYIPENRVAWHAGTGEWNDNPNYTNAMNQYAIGIELVAIGSESDMSIYLTEKEYSNLDTSLIGFTDQQYESLKYLVSDLCNRYDITMDRQHIIGHEEYSPHKTDPGEMFNWSQIIPD